MKTFIYSFIAIFIFGTIILGFTNKRDSLSNTIIIQAVKKDIAVDLLKQSANIISDRLKAVNSCKFEIAVIAEKKQIKIVFSNAWNTKEVESLLIQKGEISFYETYNQDGLTEILNGDNYLNSLISMSDPTVSGSKIGCVQKENSGKVNDYLNTLRLNQKCVFVWSQTKTNNEVCLYALKLSETKGALLDISDIESLKSVKEKETSKYEIEIKFKKSAIETWAKASKMNINKSIAIVLDNKVIYDPILKSEINNGVCTISGNFTEDEANFIVSIGNNGVLPLDFKIIK